MGVKIHLRPELEEMIKQDVQRGPCQTVDEFVEHAISLLRTKIERGYAAAQRGEPIDSAPVRSKLDERKRSRLAEKRQA